MNLLIPLLFLLTLPAVVQAQFTFMTNNGTLAVKPRLISSPLISTGLPETLPSVPTSSLE
jgi:hypothetical protein